MSESCEVVGIQSGASVVTLKPRNLGTFAHTVYQEDLEELLLLSRLFSEARDRYEAKRESIVLALNAGARVEPGVHTARLAEVQGGGMTVERFAYRRLVVR